MDVTIIVYHIPTDTRQVVNLIDFGNRYVDTYGITEPLYHIPFSDIRVESITQGVSYEKET